MDTAIVRYLGDLRTEARHVRSGNTIITDAPPDNKGRGEAFSPSDLLCSALASCMLTIMGIAARERDIDLVDLSARVVKHMGNGPRKVDRVEVHIELDGSKLDQHQRMVLERAAHTCPVALSLRADLMQDVRFTYR